MKRLYIARHGNTFESGEIPLYVGARSDLPLTEEGHKQGQRLGEVLLALGFSGTTIHSGPLKRQLETATEINSVFGNRLEIIEAAELLEIDYGRWEGLSEEEIKLNWPEEFAAWTKSATWPASIFAGTEFEQRARIESFLSSRRAGNSDELVVTSNGVLRVIFSIYSPDWDGLQSRGEAGKAKVRTGSYCLLEDNGAGWSISRWNEKP